MKHFCYSSSQLHNLEEYSFFSFLFSSANSTDLRISLSTKFPKCTLGYVLEVTLQLGRNFVFPAKIRFPLRPRKNKVLTKCQKSQLLKSLFPREIPKNTPATVENATKLCLRLSSQRREISLIRYFQ